MPSSEPKQVVETDRNLLFGVIALQSGLIDVQQFAEVCSAWASRKHEPLAALLLERGLLTDEDRSHVDYLLERKLKKHSGDIQASLAAAAGVQAREILGGLPDPDVQHSMAAMVTKEFTPPAPTAAFQLGKRERYVLRKLHATGGMGQVWLAHDAETGRDVALKELRPEKQPQAVTVARFLAEARITAQLEHPGIVPVYELVQDSKTGQPFYTMRFIKGQTLGDAVKEYHRQRKRGEATRLRLRELLGDFLAVCNAVAFAHSRGVIHRDLKGINVVLGKFGQVFVLDWGLSKLIDPQISIPETIRESAMHSTIMPVRLDPDQPSSQTMQGDVLGTPGYLAPEQAEGRPDEIDARTDVYGLGAILYEILAGRPPFRGDSTAEILYSVVYDAPTPPRRECPDVPPALEAICLRALAKAKKARYQTASELASEVQRFLADEPIAAFSDPWSVRAMRWARRHRMLVSNAAVFLVVASLGLAAGLVVLGEKHEQTLRAEEEAKQSAKKAQNAIQVLANTFEDLKPGYASSIRQFFDHTGNQIEANFAEFPIEEATLRHYLGSAYLALGYPKEAQPQLERALGLRHAVRGDDHVETIQSRRQFGLALQALDNERAAEEALRDSLDRAVAALGSEAAETLGIRNDLVGVLVDQGKVPDAEKLYRKLLVEARQSLGADHDVTLTILGDLAYLMRLLKRWHEAEELYKECAAARLRAFGPEHPQTLTAVNNFAWIRFEKVGQSAEGANAVEKILRDCLQASRRIKGEEHPETQAVVNNLAIVLKTQNKLAEAERLYLAALDASTRRLTKDHPETLMIKFNLARIYESQDNLALAEKMIMEVLEARRRVLGANHEDTQGTMIILASLLQDAGKTAESVKLYQEACALRPEDAHLASSRVHALLAIGDYEQARAGSAALVKQFGTTQKPDDAAPVLRACLVVPPALADGNVLIRLAELVPGDRESFLGAALYRAGRDKEAVTHLLKAKGTCWEWLFLSMAYQRLKTADKANEYLSRARQWMEAADAKRGKTDGRGEDWREKIRIRTLYREAEGTLEAKPAR